jgi:hypothetical protein
MKRIISALLTATAVFMPFSAVAEPTNEYFRNSPDLNHFCSAYDYGANREVVLGSYRDMLLESMPADFWNLPGASDHAQANLLTLMSHDSAITNRCSEHSAQLGTTEEWYYILEAVNMDEIIEDLGGQ